MKRDVYSRRLKLNGEEDSETVLTANNYAASLNAAQRFEEAKSLLRKTTPMAQRVLGEGTELMLRMGWIYATALCEDDAATLDDLHEAVATVEETARTTRRVFGGAHPLTEQIEVVWRAVRAALRARETLSPPGQA